MRHKVTQDVQATEPNLTPLLDLVLQILMFFITTTKLVEQEKLHKIDLPFSQTARPLDQKVKYDYEFLTIDFNPEADPGQEHEVRALGKEPFNSLNNPLQVWLKREYKRYEQRARATNKEGVDTRIIIRAHKNAEVGEVLKVFRQCQVVGFKNLQIRAFKEIGSKS